MTSTPKDHPPRAIAAGVDAWSQHVWLHPRSPAATTGDERSPAARRDFARLAVPIGLAAWMIGTALTSSCAPADVAGWATGVARRGGAVGAGIEAVPAGPSDLRCVPSVQTVAVSVPIAR